MSSIKKYCAILLTFCFLLSLAACGSNSVAGTYNLVDVTIGEKSLRGTELTDEFGSYSLKLRKDGSFTMTITHNGDSRPVTGKYTLKGKAITLTGIPLEGTFSGKKLSFHAEETNSFMTFEKQSDVSLNGVTGMYKLVDITANEHSAVLKDAIGHSALKLRKDGSFTLISAKGSSTGNFETAEGKYTLEENQLTLVSDEHPKEPIQGTLSGKQITFRTEDSRGITYIFEKE